jgi:hypothetical protein
MTFIQIDCQANAALGNFLKQKIALANAPLYSGARNMCTCGKRFHLTSNDFAARDLEFREAPNQVFSVAFNKSYKHIVHLHMFTTGKRPAAAMTVGRSSQSNLPTAGHAAPWPRISDGPSGRPVDGLKTPGVRAQR